MIPVAAYLSAIHQADYEALRAAYGLPDYAALLDGCLAVPGVIEPLECLERIMRERPQSGRAGEGSR